MLSRSLTPHPSPSPLTLTSTRKVYVNLRVSGLMSMYAFCAAVIISLCAGVVIENLDEELRGAPRVNPM